MRGEMCAVRHMHVSIEVNLQVRRSKETDKLYLDYVMWNDKENETNGIRIVKEITDEELKELLRILNRKEDENDACCAYSN